MKLQYSKINESINSDYRDKLEYIVKHGSASESQTAKSLLKKSSLSVDMTDWINRTYQSSSELDESLNPTINEMNRNHDRRFSGTPDDLPKDSLQEEMIEDLAAYGVKPEFVGHDIKVKRGGIDYLISKLRYIQTPRAKATIVDYKGNKSIEVVSKTGKLPGFMIYESCSINESKNSIVNKYHEVAILEDGDIPVDYLVKEYPTATDIVATNDGTYVVFKTTDVELAKVIDFNSYGWSRGRADKKLSNTDVLDFVKSFIK